MLKILLARDENIKRHTDRHRRRMNVWVATEDGGDDIVAIVVVDDDVTTKRQWQRPKNTHNNDKYVTNGVCAVDSKPLWRCSLSYARIWKQLDARATASYSCVVCTVCLCRVLCVLVNILFSLIRLFSPQRNSLLWALLFAMPIASVCWIGQIVVEFRSIHNYRMLCYLIYYNCILRHWATILLSVLTWRRISEQCAEQHTDRR